LVPGIGKLAKLVGQAELDEVCRRPPQCPTHAGPHQFDHLVPPALFGQLLGQQFVRVLQPEAAFSAGHSAKERDDLRAAAVKSHSLDEIIQLRVGCLQPGSADEVDGLVNPIMLDQQVDEPIARRTRTE
jgi:hypothetical protein